MCVSSFRVFALLYIYIYVKAEKENTVWFPCKEKGKNLKWVVSCNSLIILTNNGNSDFSASPEVRKLKISSANPPGGNLSFTV